MKKFHLLIIFIFTFTIYFLTSNGPTVYNQFTLLADAFLKGHLYITAIAPWLEKIPRTSNTFYVANPPMPAILSIPFVALFGKNFPQNIISSLFGAGIVLLTINLSLKIKNDIKLAIWSGLLIGFGSIIWFLSSVGSMWYFGQIVSCFFLLAALHESLGNKRIFLVGTFIGAAYLARINTIVSLPIFIYLLKDKIKLPKNLILFISSISIFMAINAFYNFARFGVFWDKGYLLIPGVTTEPWYSKGIENIAYIPRNLQVAFLSFPKFINKFPFLIPSWSGLSIWITTPAFIFALFAKLKERSVQFSWISLILVSLTVFMHGETGFAQFGYRFAVDFYPFLIFLTIKAVSQKNLKWYHWLLLIVSILVNAWGSILIEKFNLVSI